MDGMLSSLLGTWTGVDEKSVNTSCGEEGCYLVKRKFTFAVEFLPNKTLRGSLKHEDSDDCGRSSTFSGTWKVSDDGGSVISRVDQTCYVDDSDDDFVDEKQPVAEIRVAIEGGIVTHVVIDDTNSRINHEGHCEDIHVIKCARLTAL